jgi:hypothetical protein
MTMTNLNQIPTPAGAASVGLWRLDGDKTRNFHGTRRSNALDPDGLAGPRRRLWRADGDGAIQRYVLVNGDIHLDSAGAVRDLANRAGRLSGSRSAAVQRFSERR